MGAALALTLWLAGSGMAAPSPLVDAAARGDLAAVRALIATRADLESEVTGGVTPLIIAAYAGHLDVVDALLAAGARPDHTNRDQETALHASAAAPDAGPIVRRLIAARANVRQRDVNGREPLLVHAQEGHADAVEALLDAGADIDSADTEGYTALLIAAAKGNDALVARLLARHARVDAPAHGIDPLIGAADGGHLAVCRRLLDAGAKVRPPRGETPNAPRIGLGPRGTYACPPAVVPTACGHAAVRGAETCRC